MNKETENLSKEENKVLHIASVSKRLLIEMKRNACIKDGHCKSSVFSAFELACCLNDHITMYRIRKCLSELKTHGLIDLGKFNVDNESNLICWKWYLTTKGFLYDC